MLTTLIATSYTARISTRWHHAFSATLS